MEEKNSSSILKTIVNKGSYVNFWKMEEKILLTLNSNKCVNYDKHFTRWARQTTLYTKRADSYEPALYELYR